MGSKVNEMKIHALDHGERPGSGRFGKMLTGFAACLFAALPALAAAGDGPPGGGGGPGNPTVSGDETVGTLPIIGGGRINLPLSRTWRGTAPAFYLEGTAADLTLAIQAARGRGFISLEVLDPQTERIRLAFHGNVSVALDRELATSLPIEYGLAVPTSFGDGRIAFALRGGSSRSAVLHPGLLPVPVSSLSATHALDGAPARIRTGNSAGIHTTVTVAATADLLILGQSY